MFILMFIAAQFIAVFKKTNIVTAMKIGNVVCDNALEKELYEMIRSAAKDDFLEKSLENYE